MTNFEDVLLENMLHDNEFFTKVSPYIHESYFENIDNRRIYNIVENYCIAYKSAPAERAFFVELDTLKGLPEEALKSTEAKALSLYQTTHKQPNLDWLIAKTDKWIRDRSVYLGIVKCVEIMDGNDKEHGQDALPDILKNALAAGLQEQLGHDYFGDSMQRIENLLEGKNKVPLYLNIINRVTNGGFEPKTLNVFMAGTGGGKSLLMSSLAAGDVMMGRKVVYFTGEMEDEKIGHRVDAHLLDVGINDLPKLSLNDFKNKMEYIRNQFVGDIIIKEYPPHSSHKGHMVRFLNELKNKKDFVPDVIYVDYLNLFASARRKYSNTGMYEYVKFVAEELRGMAMEWNVPVITATQTNRSGYGSSDISLTDTSESFGLPMTADFMAAIVRTEDLDEDNKIMISQLKSRYGDINETKKFFLGIDISRMKVYDLDNPTEGLHGSKEDEPVFDNTNMQEQFDKFDIGDFE